MTHIRVKFGCLTAIGLGLSLSLSGCVSLSKKLDTAQQTKILSGQAGGLIVAVDSIKGVPCTTGSLGFKNLDTGETASAGFAFGMFGTKDSTNVLSVSPGRYVPTNGNCTHYYESGGFQYSKNYAFTVTPGTQEPARVKMGIVTNPGSYALTGSRNVQSFNYLDDAAALSQKIGKSYPDLTIAANP